jgi:hypothetical protein
MNRVFRHPLIFRAGMYKPSMTGNKKCATRYCRGVVTDYHAHCAKCRKIAYKQRHPERYAFYVLKNNARRRGKPFTLTMDDFKSLVETSGYMSGRGRAGDCLSIDRIDSSMGYVPGNVRVISVSENSRKSNRDNYCPF